MTDPSSHFKMPTARDEYATVSDLGYADDLVSFSSSLAGLQHKADLVRPRLLARALLRTPSGGTTRSRRPLRPHRHTRGLLHPGTAQYCRTAGHPTQTGHTVGSRTGTTRCLPSPSSSTSPSPPPNSARHSWAPPRRTLHSSSTDRDGLPRPFRSAPTVASQYWA